MWRTALDPWCFCDRPSCCRFVFCSARNIAVVATIHFKAWSPRATAGGGRVIVQSILLQWNVSLMSLFFQDKLLTSQLPLVVSTWKGFFTCSKFVNEHLAKAGAVTRVRGCLLVLRGCKHEKLWRAAGHDTVPVWRNRRVLDPPGGPEASPPRRGHLPVQSEPPTTDRKVLHQDHDVDRQVNPLLWNFLRLSLRVDETSVRWCSRMTDAMWRVLPGFPPNWRASVTACTKSWPNGSMRAARGLWPAPFSCASWTPPSPPPTSAACAKSRSPPILPGRSSSCARWVLCSRHYDVYNLCLLLKLQPLFSWTSTCEEESNTWFR